MTDLARLVARLELQTTQFQAELEKSNRKLLGFQKQSTKSMGAIERSMKNFGTVLKGAFAGLSIAAFAPAIKGAIELGDELGKLSVKAGIGVEAMSELVHAAKSADVEIAALGTSLRQMQVRVSEAATGNRKYQQTFEALGIELRDFTRLKADEQFEILGDRISKLRSATDRTRAAVELFGEAGANLLPLFEQGAKGIRKAREEAHEFGLAMSEAQLKIFQQGDDAIKKLGFAWESLMRKVAIGTLEIAQTLDVIDKDPVGELQDQLAAVNRELQAATMMPDGGAFDPETYQRLTKEAQVLQRQIDNLNSSYTRGGGPRRGRAKPAPPGFKKLAEDDIAIVGAVFDEAQMAAAARARRFGDVLDKGIRGGIQDTLRSTAEDLRDLGLVFEEESESVNTFLEEMHRSMFNDVSDLFASIGDGADNFGDRMIDTFKRVLADKATNDLFSALAGLGDSLSGKSGGSSFFGSLLTGLFGARADGGPVSASRPYVVGERGPELFVPGSTGTVVPNHALTKSAPTINVNNVYNIQSGVTRQELMPALEATRKQSVADMSRLIKGGAFA